MFLLSLSLSCFLSGVPAGCVSCGVWLADSGRFGVKQSVSQKQMRANYIQPVDGLVCVSTSLCLRVCVCVWACVNICVLCMCRNIRLSYCTLCVCGVGGGLDLDAMLGTLQEHGAGLILLWNADLARVCICLQDQPEGSMAGFKSGSRFRG